MVRFDYVLNKNTRWPIFHIPTAREIFDKVGGNRYFSTLDLSKGYYQVRVCEKDIHKTAFSTPLGQFEFSRMQFGLNGAPATFQGALTSTLGDLVSKTCCVYLDNVIIFGKSE